MRYLFYSLISKTNIIVLVLRNQYYNFGGKLAKVGVESQDFNAGFVKLTLNNNVFNWSHQTYSKQGRKRPLDTPKRMINRRKERERKVEGKI